MAQRKRLGSYCVSTLVLVHTALRRVGRVSVREYVVREYVTALPVSVREYVVREYVTALPGRPAWPGRVAGRPAWPGPAVGIYTVGSTACMVWSVVCRLYDGYGCLWHLTYGDW